MQLGAYPPCSQAWWHPLPQQLCFGPSWRSRIQQERRGCLAESVVIGTAVQALTSQCLCLPLSGYRKHTYQGMEPFNIYIPGPLTVLKLDLLMRLWLLLKSHWNLFLASSDGSPLLTHLSSGICGSGWCVLFCSLCVRQSQSPVLLKGVWTFSSLGFNGFQTCEIVLKLVFFFALWNTVIADAEEWLGKSFSKKHMAWWFIGNTMIFMRICGFT